MAFDLNDLRSDPPQISYTTTPSEFFETTTLLEQTPSQVKNIYIVKFSCFLKDGRYIQKEYKITRSSSWNCSLIDHYQPLLRAKFLPEFNKNFHKIDLDKEMRNKYYMNKEFLISKPIEFKEYKNCYKLYLSYYGDLIINKSDIKQD